MESEKVGIDDLIYKAEIETRRREQMYGYQGGKGSGINWDIGIDIYTLLILCIKYLTNENLLCSTGTLLNALW